MTLANLVVSDGDSYRGSRAVDVELVADADPFTAGTRLLLVIDGRQRIEVTPADLQALLDAARTLAVAA